MRLGIDSRASDESALLLASSASSRSKSNRLRAPSDSDVLEDPISTQSTENITSINVHTALKKLLAFSDNKGSVHMHNARFSQYINPQNRIDPTSQLEKLSEARASISVSCSDAYERLCASLEKAHLDTEKEMRTSYISGKMHEDTFRQTIENLTAKQIRKEQEKKKLLKQLHDQEKAALAAIERRLQAYEASQVERIKERKEEEESRKKEEEKAKQIKAQEEIVKVKVDHPPASSKEKERAIKVIRKEPDHVILAQNRLKKLDLQQKNADEILASTDPSMKKLRVELKKQGGACNQISASPSSVQRVVQKISALLQYARISGQKFNDFALNLVASNLIKQARGASDYRACFPIAYVMTMCCVSNTELTDVLLAYFHKLCVFTIPTTIQKQKDQSIVEYKRALGFEEAVGESSDADGLEHVTEYSKRMTMVAAVLAAVMQTRPWEKRSKPKGIQLGDCWAWLARLVNEPPHLMTGPIVLTILEVAGYELCEEYKSQFRKLMALIETQICPNLSKNAKSGAANATGQLETLLSQYKANRERFMEPEGRKLKETKLTERDEERTEDSGSNSNWNRSNRHGGGRGRGYRRY
ncbi:unnamed protein product [Albugo candida]|uniref:mRNA export factor GLE1 n=1 Tax=Albugo candida TaxID=65357 RepID=A0A024G8M3_9STRA|nr:unnamed protein product [Albugo candida]|eukprot:CCI43108.1 unnamed protein product [Albugo candida]